MMIVACGMPSFSASTTPTCPKPRSSDCSPVSTRSNFSSRMAEAMGITGATLTHHLNALERQGLVHRWRDAGNRRGQQAELTEAGEALFARLRQVAATHDRRLRSHLTDDETAQLAELLEKLQAGIEAPEVGRA